MVRRRTPQSQVQSVDRALRIVELLADSGRPLPLTSISQALGMNVATVHRLLSTLMARGFVVQSVESSKYRLGFKILECASSLLEHIDLRREAHPAMAELGERCGEVCHLGVLEQDEVVYIDKVESNHTLRMYSRIGRRCPVYCTALGKSILAFLPEAEASRIISSLEFRRYGPNTVTSAEELASVLARVRALGYAVDDEEHEEGIRCVAAPILNHEGRPVASLSVSGPATRLTPERVESLVPLVRQAADRVSARLGFRRDAERRREPVGQAG